MRSSPALLRMKSSLGISYGSFEIFGWALLNLLYMVTALTAKRAFEKADQPS